VGANFNRADQKWVLFLWFRFGLFPQTAKNMHLVRKKTAPTPQQARKTQPNPKNPKTKQKRSNHKTTSTKKDQEFCSTVNSRSKSSEIVRGR